MGRTTSLQKVIGQCENCQLCKNQRPLLDNKTKADVMWVGLSAVKVECTKIDTPLSPTTSSGRLILEIEEQTTDVEFYKTNLVKCLPTEHGKIRYPKFEEMSSCYGNLEKEISRIRPRLVFLLGKQVSSFVNGNNRSELITQNRNLEIRRESETIFVSIHHPSYIQVYKRKTMKKYIRDVSDLILRYSNV